MFVEYREPGERGVKGFEMFLDKIYKEVQLNRRKTFKEGFIMD